MKKGMVIWEVLVWAIILIVVAMLLIYVFKGSLDQQRTVINDQVGGANDKDGDFVPDAFDKCKDKPTSDPVGSDGCSDKQREALQPAVR